MIGTIFFLIGNNYNGDSCHPYTDLNKLDPEPWEVSAHVYGPFNSIEQGVAWLTHNVSAPENGDVMMVIDTAKGTIVRHVAKAAQPVLAPTPR